MDRRDFVKKIGLTSAALAMTHQAKEQKIYAQNQIKEKPNIIFAIADDMTWAHTSYLGYKGVKTPNFDFVAKQGVYFENAYCSAPSSAPSRASVLSGRNGWELEQGAVLWGQFPAKFETYPALLEKNGYHVGSTGKGWAPGSLEDSGRKQNPSGKEYNDIKNRPWTEYGVKDEIWDIDYAKNFKQFLNDKNEDQPFCFWMGALEPHRVYSRGIGKRMGKKIEDVVVPEFLPDTPEVRSDILDYLVEIEWYDIQLGRIIETLKEQGQFDNTIIVITSDNGMPFPRAKANLYEYGTHMPLAVCWGDKIKGNREIKDFISFKDFAPTFLEAAGVEIPQEMSGKSFLPQLLSDKSGQIDPQRNVVHTYKERHSWCLPDGVAYPMRAIREDDFLLIWNLRPHSWPAGHELPEYNWNLFPFGDCDDGLSKEVILSYKFDPENRKYYDLAFSKRPEFELYQIKDDPYQLNNLVDQDQYQQTFQKLSKKLKQYLTETGDLRMSCKGDVYEQTPYYCTQGLETGGKWLEEWEKLNPIEKEKAVDQTREWIQDKIQELKKLQKVQ